jgi:NAD(P)-dependent dehydrogenase (short-subunit alcohol dehydrogenase family)
MLLNEKVAIVTGGGRGIGRATALAMARQGAAVVVAARTESEIEAVAEAIQATGGQGLALRTDMTDPAQVERLVSRTLERFGRIDVMVNNAGAPGRVALARYVTPEEWDETIRANLTSVFLGSRAVLDLMIAQGHGKIINVASSLAERVLPGISAYSAAKAAIVHFSRILAAEVAEYNIQVNAVWPGVVETRFVDALRAASVEEAGEVLYRRTRSLHRITPEESALLFVFLASDAAGDLSGEFVQINDPQIQERIRALGLTPGA